MGDARRQRNGGRGLRAGSRSKGQRSHKGPAASASCPARLALKDGFDTGPKNNRGRPSDTSWQLNRGKCPHRSALSLPKQPGHFCETAPPPKNDPPHLPKKQTASFCAYPGLILEACPGGPKNTGEPICFMPRGPRVFSHWRGDDLKNL